MEEFKVDYDEYKKALDRNIILKEEITKLTQEKFLNKRNEEVFGKLTEKLNKLRKDYTTNLVIINYYENYIMEKGEDKNDKHKRK